MITLELVMEIGIPKNKIELKQIISYQEMLRTKYNRYISFSEAIALWMSEQQKDQPLFINVLFENTDVYH